MWILTLLPTLSITVLWREVATPAGGIPVLVWLLGVFGMFWADVSWYDRIAGLGGFHKLLVVPLLLAQFRRSKNADWIFAGYLISCVALLVLSFLFVMWPEISWRWARFPGVPVKDYIAQSGEFALCAFILLPAAIAAQRVRQPALAAGLIALALLFLFDILYVAVSRTSLIVIIVLLVLFLFQHWGRKSGLILLVTGAAMVGVWASSAELRKRVNIIAEEIYLDRTKVDTGAVPERLEYWKKSVEFVTSAPIFGHGTGSIRELFRRSSVGQSGISALVTSNPHNQILAIAVQLGLVGVGVLFAMWAAHLLLFRGNGIPNWIGLVLVIQNVVGSLFNAHLFDFTQGWTYVFGIGVAGGVVLGNAVATADCKDSSETRQEL